MYFVSGRHEYMHGVAGHVGMCISNCFRGMCRWMGNIQRIEGEGQGLGASLKAGRDRGRGRREEGEGLGKDMRKYM